MPIFSTAGTKLFIGGVIDVDEDLDADSFDGVTWVEVGHTENLGRVGDTAQEITTSEIGRARTQKLKGSRDAGTMEVVVNIDVADPGQLALIAAEKTQHSYAFKLEFPDKPVGVGATPSLRLFGAMLMSIAETMETANNVMQMTASLAVNSNVVRVAADDGT